MELRHYVAVLRRRWLLVALSLIAGMAAGYTTTPRTDFYMARAQIYAGARTFTADGRISISNDQLYGIQTLIFTYARMIATPATAEAALRLVPEVERSPAAVIAGTRVVNPPGTLLLEVRYFDVNPGVAQDLANAMADAFVERIQAYDPAVPPEEGEPPVLPANVNERARLPTAPVPNDVTTRIVLGGLFGLLLAAALTFSLEYIDITIKGPADAERRLELPVLGVIPVQPQQSIQGAGSSSAAMASQR